MLFLKKKKRLNRNMKAIAPHAIIANYLEPVPLVVIVTVKVIGNQRRTLMFSFPEIKFAHTNTIGQQIEHIQEEFIEAMKEVNDGNMGAADIEFMDLWHSLETYFRIRQKQGISVHATARAVLEKNEKRRYYDRES